MSQSDFHKEASTYWDYVKVRYKECKARAITVHVPNGKIIIDKGPDQSPHAHAPNREEAEAEKLRSRLKRKAGENDIIPALLLREELEIVPSGILSQLPERENLKQSIRRVRAKKKRSCP